MRSVLVPPPDLPLLVSERQTEETCPNALAHSSPGASLPSPRALPEEGPANSCQQVPAWLLRDPALPGLILQGKQLSNHRWGGGALHVWKAVLAFSAHSVRFCFGVTGKTHRFHIQNLNKLPLKNNSPEISFHRSCPKTLARVSFGAAASWGSCD